MRLDDYQRSCSYTFSSLGPWRISHEIITRHSYYNYLPFLLDFFRGKRGALLQLLSALDLRSSTQEAGLIKAMHCVLENKDVKHKYITSNIDLSFTTEQWRKLIIKKKGKKRSLNHRYLELCVLSHVANQL